MSSETLPEEKNPKVSKNIPELFKLISHLILFIIYFGCEIYS